MFSDCKNITHKEFLAEKKIIVDSCGKFPITPARLMASLAQNELNPRYEITKPVYKDGSWHCAEISYTYKGKPVDVAVWAEKYGTGRVLVSLVTQHNEEARRLLNSVVRTIDHLIFGPPDTGSHD